MCYMRIRERYLYTCWRYAFTNIKNSTEKMFLLLWLNNIGPTLCQTLQLLIKKVLFRWIKTTLGRRQLTGLKFFGLSTLANIRLTCYIVKMSNVGPRITCIWIYYYVGTTLAQHIELKEGHLAFTHRAKMNFPMLGQQSMFHSVDIGPS